jgi:outer membrane receptor protein involved in Fe transport
MLGVLTVGVQTRDDIIPSVGLYHTEHEVRLGTVRQDAIDETSTGAFADVSTHWLPWFRTEFGLRGDAYTFDVASNDPANSGRKAASLASPKAALTFTPSSVAEFYLDGGFGYHSNDARAVTITVDPLTHAPVQSAPALVRSRGAEVGARITPTSTLTSSVALWALNLDSELIYDGDAGTNDPSSPSRRLGVTWSNVYHPIAQLAFDADISYAHTRFADVPIGQTFVPGALENTLVAGVAWTPAPRGLFAALRVRRFGSYPLVQDNSVRAPATMVVNADVGYALASGIRVQLALLNLFNSLGDDIDYYYASRLPGEPAGGVMDQHLHPIEPRQFRITVAWGL